MKTKNLSLAAAGLAVLAFSTLPGSRVSAGATLPPTNVFISSTTGSGFAYGNLGAVHNSGGRVEDIGCASYFSRFDVAPLIGCSATNAAGQSKTCWFTNSAIETSGVMALKDDSMLYFYWDDSGTCIDVRVINSSRYESKKL